MINEFSVIVFDLSKKNNLLNDFYASDEEIQPLSQAMLRLD